MVEKTIFNESEAAFYVGLAKATLRQARCHGCVANKTPVPKHFRIGRSVRYHLDDLNTFIEEMRGIEDSIQEGK